MQGSGGVRVLLPERQRESSLTLGQLEQSHAERTCVIRLLNPVIHGPHCDGYDERRADGQGVASKLCPVYQRASPIAVDTEQLFCAFSNG